MSSASVWAIWFDSIWLELTQSECARVSVCGPSCTTTNSLSRDSFHRFDRMRCDLIWSDRFISIDYLARAFCFELSYLVYITLASFCILSADHHQLPNMQRRLITDETWWDCKTQEELIWSSNDPHTHTVSSYRSVSVVLQGAQLFAYLHIGISISIFSHLIGRCCSSS